MNLFEDDEETVLHLEKEAASDALVIGLKNERDRLKRWLEGIANGEGCGGLAFTERLQEMAAQARCGHPYRPMSWLEPVDPMAKRVELCVKCGNPK